MSNIKFGTDGWRAIMCEEFTFNNVRMVVQGIADYVNQEKLQHRGIVVGYDTRFLAEKFAQVAVSVLGANGIKVFLVQQATPTPVTAFAIKDLNAGGAIMFTASHNPPEYNGIKFIPEYAGPATPEITNQLEKLISAVVNGKPVQSTLFTEVQTQGMVEYIDPRSNYEAHIASLVNFQVIRESKLKLVVDPMYGAGMGYSSEILRHHGCQVLAIHEHRDPLFGGSLPEPTAAELQELIDLVRSEGAQLGLANDGDADRFGVIDADGTYITPNQVIALLLLHLVKNRGYTGGVARSVATTHLIDAIAAKYDLPVYETPVGFKYIGAKMLSQDVIIGGEESGGLSIKGHIPEKDGILANLLIAELRAVEGKNIQQILAQVASEFGEFYNKRLDLHLPEEQKQQILSDLQTNPPAELAGMQVKEVLTIDGIKLNLMDGSWALFRPSGTEPLMRVYSEAHSTEALQTLETAVRSLTGLI